MSGRVGAALGEPVVRIFPDAEALADAAAGRVAEALIHAVRPS